uniref:Uncharacterized protein n=1 Tax=Candida parapsilosis (strain CDC 317 / ATCC MYA-4646) TaxID=578454 RepID=A0AAJ8W509_CANPC
MLTQAVN